MSSHAALPFNFRLLDELDEFSQFSRSSATSSSVKPAEWISSIVVKGMHCAACALNVERSLLQIPGVLEAQVNASTGHARVRWQAAMTRPSQWFQAIVDAGYQALPAAQRVELESTQRASRLALWRWLVAGLCMMQVMMYAWPEYVALPGDMSSDALHLLRWASWLLTLPVILFSSQPFLSSAWRDIKAAHISMDLPVALGIIMAFAVSTVGTFEPIGPWGQEVYFDSLSMFVFFLLTGRWLEQRLRAQTAGALDELMNRLPNTVERLTSSGVYESVLARQLKADDFVRVAVGQAFPADGILIEGVTQADEALLTGESTPIAKQVGDAVIAGSYNQTAVVVMQVKALGQDTQFAKILSLMAQAAQEKPHWAQLADRVAKPFLWSVLLISALVLLWGWQDHPAQAVMRAVAVLIVTCPCALALATPVAMLTSAGALSRQGIVVRRLQALETLSQVKTIIVDKTGTLTEGRLSLYQARINPKLNPRLGMKDILQLAATLGQDSPHPIAKALVFACEQQGFALPPNKRLQRNELPGSGIAATLIDANDSEQNRDYRLGSAAFCGVSPLDSDKPQVHLVQFANGELLHWLASFEFQESIRPEAMALLEHFQQAGMQVQLLSGDTQLATQTVARQLGIQHFKGGCTPSMKLAHMKHLQQQGQLVAMVGDGLNDGPVLSGADVSFAFGRALPQTQSKADFWIMSSRLTQVAQCMAQARRTLRVVKQNLIWALVYNAVAVPLAVAGSMPAWAAGIGMASSSLLVVLNASRLRSFTESQ